MSDFWHKLGCCVVEKPQPKRRRRRIDRTMIGEPMNFVHLTHIGSGDMTANEGLPMVQYERGAQKVRPQTSAPLLTRGPPRYRRDPLNQGTASGQQLERGDYQVAGKPCSDIYTSLEYQ
uniref:CDC42 small effector 1 n=1 Tax=Sphenodon punctatus TaxID=8508 RepID=A0A8D0GEU9_SPHPU